MRRAGVRPVPAVTDGPPSADASAWEEQGFAAVPQVLTPRTCEAICRRVRTSSLSGGSRNLLTRPWCEALVARLRRHSGVGVLLPAGHVAIQCTYFEKSVARNWAVHPHQDLSVPVADRVDGAGLTGWSRKEGALYVQPPVELLARLIAVRVHLDPCTVSDGPIRLVPGSHRWGRLPESDVRGVRCAADEIVCTAQAGEALVMRPLLMHSSPKSQGTGRRRVLHLVFAPMAPGHGLQWQHAA